MCGALWNASNHAEEFDFEFGDRIDSMIDISETNLSSENMQNQLIVDFEEELKKVSSEFSRDLQKSNKALTPGDDFYLANDILII